jgi:hypothetical protein
MGISSDFGRDDQIAPITVPRDGLILSFDELSGLTSLEVEDVSLGCLAKALHRIRRGFPISLSRMKDPESEGFDRAWGARLPPHYPDFTRSLFPPTVPVPGSRGDTVSVRPPIDDGLTGRPPLDSPIGGAREIAFFPPVTGG